MNQKDNICFPVSFLRYIQALINLFFFFFGLRFYDPVNSYGHVEMVRSPNHTFSSASLT